MSLSQLEDRLALASVEAGFIREDEFQSTRPRTAHLPIGAQTPGELPKDPAAVLGLLRQMSAGRVGIPPPATENP